jgi:hypothetical protein
MKACKDKEIPLKKFMEGNLAREGSESLKSHLLKCEACRHVLHRKNPLLMFSLLSQQTREDNFWYGYWETIRERISVRRNWFEWLGFVKPLPAAVVLSSLVIVTFLFLFVILNESPVGPPPVVEVLPAEGEVVEETVLNPPLLIGEGKGLESANIVTISVQNTDIVMIYDESMDI